MVLNVATDISTDWLNLIALQFNQAAHDPALFSFHDQRGKVTIKCFPLEQGVVATYWHFLLDEPIEICQKSSVDSEYYTLYIIQGVPYHLSRQNHSPNEFPFRDGIQLLHAQSDTMIYLAEAKSWEYMTITFSKKMLQDSSISKQANEDRYAHKLTELKQPLYVYEASSFHTQQLINQLKNPLIETLSLFKIKTLCSFLLVSVIDRLSQSAIPSYKKFRHVDPDIENVLRIEAELSKKYQLPNINLLAREAGMSLTKFRQLFKQLFGLPVYEYCLQHRMEKAKELLHGGLTVSEVATQLEYSKLHYFSKSFKSYTGSSPSIFQQNLSDSNQLTNHEEGKMRGTISQ